MIKNRIYMILSCALLFIAADYSSAKQAMKSKTAAVNSVTDAQSERELRDAIDNKSVVVVKAYSPDCDYIAKNINLHFMLLQNSTQTKHIL